MNIPGRSVFGLLRQTLEYFSEDDCATQAAALSYYTAFSLPPLLGLILILLGTLLDPADIRGALEAQIEGLMGRDGGEQVRAMLAQARPPGGNALVPTLIGLASLLFGATGAFAQLQGALNRAWEVAPDPKRGGIRNFVGKRLLSFSMVLAIAFLLLVSLVVTAIISAFGDMLARTVLASVSEPLLYVIDVTLTLAVMIALFAAMFRYLPDAVVEWKDAWVGAAATAVLFMAGKFLIGFYLGRSNPGQAYGAAGSLVIVLLWIYYSSMILLFGAELTQAWAERHGRAIEPEPGAVRIVREKHRLTEAVPGR